jgi:Protein of unknown function (DUF4232)
MDPTRKTDRLLEEWDAVARSARQPAAAPHRRGVFAGSALGLVGAAALAVALLVGVGWLGGRMTAGDVGGSPTPVPSQVAAAPSPSASASVAPSPSIAPSPSPAITPKPTAAPTPTPRPTASCVEIRAEGKLEVGITAWEGAAGNRIADVSMTNHAAVPCVMYAKPVPDLLDHSGKLLARGTSKPSGVFRVDPGETVTTLVDVANVCDNNPQFPLTVAFEQGADGRIIADPLSPNDMTVPPCNGPGSPASIQMQPWSR